MFVKDYFITFNGKKGIQNKPARLQAEKIWCRIIWLTGTIPL